MLIPRDWNDEPEVHEAVASALLNFENDEEGEEIGFHGRAGTEHDGYGNEGTILVQVNGKWYSLSLYEIN